MSSLTRPSLLAVIALAAAFATVPTVAPAASCVSAPGTSAVDQYCEAIPGAGGGTSSGGGSKGDPGNAVPPRTASQLDQPGATNAGVRALLSTGPAAQGQGSSAAGRAAKGAHSSGSTVNGKPRSADHQAATDDVSPLRVVASAVSDGPTLGAGLPIVLLGTAVAAAGILWVRSRRDSSS